jgi:hypothetical protein
VLSFEVFIGRRDTLAYLTEFLGRWIPAYLVAPGIIGAAGVLLAVYSALVFLAGAGQIGRTGEPGRNRGNGRIGERRHG